MTTTLSRFIREHAGVILDEWDSYAHSLALGLGPTSLRNDAARLLNFIANDLETAQSVAEQRAKSQGRGTALHPDSTVSSEHGVHRYREGFDVNQVLSEYRALRATVTRMWVEHEGATAPHVQPELVRFNESIDQLVAESVASFTREVDASRQLFLGTLGHDLRSPLSAIHATGAAWLRDPSPRDVDRARAERVVRAAERMRAMISDLLDFTRTQRGSLLPVTPEPCNAGKVFQDVVDEIQSATQVDIKVTAMGELDGHWDCSRLGQLASNLVSNAVTHGSRVEPIRVALVGHQGYIEINLFNSGGTLGEADRRSVFEPLMRGARVQTASQGLGLGLYICKQIVQAHHGSIELHSLHGGTEVRVKLPKDGARIAGTS